MMKSPPNEDASSFAVIWRRDAFVTYLFHFRRWDVANPRTTKPFSNNLLIFLLHCFRNLNYCWHRQMEQLLLFWPLMADWAASEPSEPSSKDVESILRTEFHAGSANFSCQVLLKCFCTWDIFHNRNLQWCFWATVSFLLHTSSWQESFGESLSGLTIDSKTMSEFTFSN